MKTLLPFSKMMSLLAVTVLFSFVGNHLHAQVSEADKAILIDLYDSTNGDSWTNKTNWGSSEPVNSWYGVTVVGNEIIEIELDKNNLSGPIPASLGQLVSLEFLKLDTNNISGTIPVELGNLASLQQFYLGGNQLTGPIPTSMGLLSNLRWLNLSNNQLNGTIPIELGQLAQLEYLQLSKNQLTGNIPAILGSLSNLKWLDLGENLLDGNIPLELGTLSVLEQLYLDNNQLTGSIPGQFNNLTALRWLNLGQNQLTGVVPVFPSLTNLSLMYLDNNLLQGGIPPEIKQLTTLEWLNLSGNQLEGRISFDLWQLTNLKLLYLNSNQIFGAVSDSLDNLTELRFADFSSNMFDAFPEITTLPNLSDLKVSNNMLDFGHLEYNMDLISTVSFIYSPQDSIGTKEVFGKAEGDAFSYTLNTGGTQNSYQWFKDGVILATQTSETLEIPVIAPEDEGVYHCRVTNTLVTGLTLTSREIILNLEKCQELICNVGWNIVSSPFMPASTDIEDIFQPFIDNSSLIKIQDELGNTLEDLGIYGGWTNTIGDISTSEGYKIKMSAQDVINVCGLPVSYPFEIELKNGWNIIGYPQSEAYDGMDAIVQQLIDNGTLIKVQDEGGNTIEDLGIYGGWKNTIGDFVPGKGYKIKVNADDILTIYDSYPKSSSKFYKPVASEYFKPDFIGNGLDHMNIHIVNLVESGITIGDEIGIFDGDICVGGVKITDLDNSVFSMIASADDETNNIPDGFVQGNNINLRLLHNHQEYPIDFIPVSGSSTQFEKNGSLFAKVGVDISTSAPTINDSDLGFECYPNPFSNKLNIEIHSLKSKQITVEIYDMVSRRVIQLYNGKAEGLTKLQWDGTDSEGNKVAPGVYFCRVNETIKKVVLN